MAAAVVSGAVALLLEERPGMRPLDDEGGAAADEHVHAGGGAAAGRRGEPECLGGGGIRPRRQPERYDDRGAGGGAVRL